MLDCLSIEDNLRAFYQLCLAAHDQFQTATQYCAWLTEFCYLVHNPKVAIVILTENFLDLPDTELYEHLGYFLALLYAANSDPKKAVQHLQNALVINEENIQMDFLDIDTEKIYAKYPDIYFIVSPYLDQQMDIRSN